MGSLQVCFVDCLFNSTIALFLVSGAKITRLNAGCLSKKVLRYNEKLSSADDNKQMQRYVFRRLIILTSVFYLSLSQTE